MRRAAVVIGVIGLVVATAVGVWAAGGGGGRVDTQTFSWTDEAATTTSTEWQSIPELPFTTNGCHGNRKASATLSLLLADDSSPVEVRIAVSNPLCPSCEAEFLHPGVVSMSPGASSFTFVGRPTGDHGTAFDPEWRLPEDASANSSATLESGTLQVLWKKVQGRCA